MSNAVTPDSPGAQATWFCGNVHQRFFCSVVSVPFDAVRNSAECIVLFARCLWLPPPDKTRCVLQSVSCTTSVAQAQTALGLEQTSRGQTMVEMKEFSLDHLCFWCYLIHSSTILLISCYVGVVSQQLCPSRIRHLQIISYGVGFFQSFFFSSDFSRDAKI